jgi:hypothetical protein
VIDVPDYLTPNATKRSYFAGDPFFREGWEDFASRFSPDAIRSRTWRYASIVFKPEAFVVRGVSEAVARIRRAGFSPTVVRPLAFDRLAVRETWRYWYDSCENRPYPHVYNYDTTRDRRTLLNVNRTIFGFRWGHHRSLCSRTFMSQTSRPI